MLPTPGKFTKLLIRKLKTMIPFGHRMKNLIERIELPPVM